MELEVRIKIAGPVNASKLAKLNRRLLKEVRGYHFEIDEQGSAYLNTNWRYWSIGYERYWSIGYERGPWPLISATLDLVKVYMPDNEIYYGSDSEDNIGRLGLWTKERKETYWNHYLSENCNEFYTKP